MSEWISAEIWVPEGTEDVLVAYLICERLKYCVAWYSHKNERWMSFCLTKKDSKNVKYWMPLPEPPKEENQVKLFAEKEAEK